MCPSNNWDPSSTLVATVTNRRIAHIIQNALCSWPNVSVTGITSGLFINRGVLLVSPRIFYLISNAVLRSSRSSQGNWRDSTQRTTHAVSRGGYDECILDDSGTLHTVRNMRGRGWNLDLCSSGRTPPPPPPNLHFNMQYSVLPCMKVPGMVP